MTASIHRRLQQALQIDLSHDPRRAVFYRREEREMNNIALRLNRIRRLSTTKGVLGEKGSKDVPLRAEGGVAPLAHETRQVVGPFIRMPQRRSARGAPISFRACVRLLLKGETTSECRIPIHEVCLQRATMLAAPPYWTFPTCEMELIDPTPPTAAYGRAACQRRFITEPLRMRIRP
jgi:hypothetical protein